MFVTGPLFYDGLYQWNSGAVLTFQHNSTLNRLIVTLPPGTTAVGSDIMTILPDAQPVKDTLATGEVFTARTFEQPARAFIGILSSSPVASLEFSAAGVVAAHDDTFDLGNGGL